MIDASELRRDAFQLIHRTLRSFRTLSTVFPRRPVHKFFFMPKYRLYRSLDAEVIRVFRECENFVLIPLSAMVF